MIAIFKHGNNGIYFIDVVLHHVLKKVKAVCICACVRMYEYTCIICRFGTEARQGVDPLELR